jgi:iron complex outermembrane recepter protein
MPSEGRLSAPWMGSIATIAIIGGVTPARAQDAAVPAASNPATPEQVAIEDIVVTAQRRSESLNSVPIAVSALSGEALADRQIRTTSDIQLALPNVTFTKDNFSSSNFTIRGIGQSVVAVSSDQGTGIHYNDMPLTYPRLFEAEFFDLERVEVLRGPQGTLYGRNATGGVMNIITARPEFRWKGSGSVEYGNYNGARVEGMINVPVSQDLALRLAGLYISRDGYTRNLYDGSRIDGRNQYALRGSLRYEPSDDWSVDLSGYYYHEDSDRARSQKQLCHRDPTGILGCLPDSLKYETVNANATTSAIAASREFLGLVDPALAAFGLTSVAEPDFLSSATNPRDLRTVSIDFNPTYRASEFIGMGKIAHDMGSINASLVGGYMHSKAKSRADYDLAVAAPITGTVTGATGLATFLNAPLTAGVAQAVTRNGQLCASNIDATMTGYIGGRIQGCSDRTINYDESYTNNRQWAGEFKLASSFDGPLNFLLGTNYLDFRSDTYYAVASSTGFDYPSALLGAAQGFAATGNPFQGVASPVFMSRSNYRLKAFGLFGEGYWKLAKDLKFTAGLRFTHDRKRVEDFDPLPILALGPVPLGTTSLDDRVTTRSGRVSFKRLTGRAVLDWQPETRFSDKTLVYLSYSRGYKGGGINLTASGLSANTAQRNFAPETVDAFEIGTKNSFAGNRISFNLTGFYYDYRGYQITRIVNRTPITDNTDARIYGVEAELVARPVRPLSINATLSYLHTEVRNLQLINPRDPTGGRDDVLLIKDLVSGGNCVVQSNTPGVNATQALAATGAGLTAAAGTPGLPAGTAQQLAQAGALASGTAAGAVPVPTLRSPGAYGACAVLSNVSTAAATVLGAAPFSIVDGIQVDVSGNALPNAPRWRAALGAQYDQPIGKDFELSGRVDYSFTSSAYSRVFANGADRIASYNIVNAQITLSRADRQWNIRGFVQNLFNKNVVTGQYLLDPTSGLATNVFLLEPRRYGIAASFAF